MGLDFNKPENILFELESKRPVEKIVYNGISIWPFLRVFIYRKLFDKYHGENITSKKAVLEKCIAIKNHINGIILTDFRLFKKCGKSLFFVSNFQGRELDGKLVNQLTGEFEQMVANFIPIMQIYSKKTKKMYHGKYINEQLVNDVITLHSKKMKIDNNLFEGRDILDSILKDVDLNYNYLPVIKKIICGINFYQKWFEKTKPNLLVIECYYDYKMCAIYAAKLLGIVTVEMQHGLINSKVYEYNTKKLYNNNPFPQWLFCFGESEKKAIGGNNVYENEKIIPVGSYYLDYKRKNINSSKELFCMKYSIKKRTTVAVIGQYSIDDILMQKIDEMASLDNQISYIFLPRIVEEKHKRLTRDNIFVEDKLDVYTMMQVADLTISVYSTCVLESIALGTPVMLIDIEGLASYYYGDLSQKMDSLVIKSVDDTTSEYINTIRKLSSISKDKVKIDGDYLYQNNHMKSVKKAYKTISQ